MIIKGRYVLSIDSSSSACKAALVDLGGEVLKFSSVPLDSYRNEQGLCEYDATEIWDKQLFVLREVIKDVDLREIVGIGISNQRETVVAWDLDSKQPVCRAISWQDSRTKSFCEKYKRFSDLVRRKTGLYLNSYFSVSKIQWILENVEFNLDTLRVGTVDSWLIFNLTNYEVHATDLTNASRTSLFNLDTESWDEDLLELFEIPKRILPEIKSSGDFYGFWEYQGIKIPIYGVIGDQQASLLSGSFDRGGVKCTYGTGLFLLANLGDRKEYFDGTVTTVAWKIFKEKTFYAIECGSFVCGNLIQKLFEERLFNEYSIKDLSIEDSIFLRTFDGRLFIFDGKMYPDLIWNLDLQESTGESILKGAINSIVLIAMDLFRLIGNNMNVREVCISGELIKLDYLRNVKRWLLGVDLVGLNFENHSMLGAAYLVMVAAGCRTFEEIKTIIFKNSVVYKSNFRIPSSLKLLERWETYKSAL